MIHPSLIEKISLDERQANQALVDDLKRSYPYVGPVTVTKHAATDPACNVMRLIVRMGRPYWSSADPQGDEMWQAVSTWLDAKLYKVGSTMANFNKSRAEKGQQTVDYGRVELDMKPYLFSMALPTTGALPEAQTLVARFRELLNQGTFGGTVVRVQMPSADSWAAQYAAAEQAAKEKGALEGDVAGAAEAEVDAHAEGADRSTAAEGAAGSEGIEAAPAGQAAGRAAELAAGEVPAPEGGAAVAGDVPAGSGEGVAETTAPAVLPVTVEAVDYRLWDVAFADGTVRTLDSSTGAWL